MYRRLPRNHEPSALKALLIVMHQLHQFLGLPMAHAGTYISPGEAVLGLPASAYRLRVMTRSGQAPASSVFTLSSPVTRCARLTAALYA
jgi:hypothetical protein